MATRYSTGAVNAFAGTGKDHAFIGTNISFAATGKTIASAGNAFSTASIAGDKVRILGSQLNDGLYTIASVDPAGASIVVLENLQDEAAAAKIAVVCMSTGGSFKEIFENSVGAFYTGPQPTTADLAETGTLLGYLTVDGGAFTPGSATNGLNWADAVGGVCQKNSDTFKCIPIASGSVGYMRLYSNAMVTGASSTAIRVDLACGVGTGECRLSSTSFTVGVPVTITSCTGTASKTPIA